MGIPAFRDFQGAVGTGENLLLVFNGFHGPAFSTALRLFADGPAGSRVAAEHVRSIPDRHRPIQMLMNGHRTAGQRTAEPALLQLPVPVCNRDHIVLGHHAFGLYAEDPVQIRTRRAPERCSFLRRRHGELLIEGREVTLAQKCIRPFQRSDSRQPQLLRQPSLPGSKVWPSRTMS